jgi:hypothetical protein
MGPQRDRFDRRRNPVPHTPLAPHPQMGRFPPAPPHHPPVPNPNFTMNPYNNTYNPYITPPNDTLNNSLTSLVDKLSTSLIQQNDTLKDSIYQGHLDSKEQYLSNAKMCDGSNHDDFSTWLDDVSRLSLIANKKPELVAATTSRGPLHKYVDELTDFNLPWLSIKAKLQERFSECGSSSMAKHKLTSIKQDQRPMHIYVSKFTDMLEHAYGIGPDHQTSQILASPFIDGIDSPHVRNKLRSHNVTCLKEMFTKAMFEDERQKLRALDFCGSSVNSSSGTHINEVDINALISGRGCYNCGDSDHFAKLCPKPRACNNCGATDHFWRDCPQKKPKPFVPYKVATTGSQPAVSDESQATMTKLIDGLASLLRKLDAQKTQGNTGYKPSTQYPGNTGYKPRPHYQNNNGKHFHKYMPSSNQTSEKKPFTKVQEVEVECDCDYPSDVEEKASEPEAQSSKPDAPLN